MILGGVDDDSLKAMDELVDHEGITSFKLFMAYPGVFYSDDGQILRAMQTASDNGAMIMMHAENGIAIDVLVAAGAGPGRDRPDLPRPHPAVGARGGGHPPGDHAGRRRRRLPALHRAHVGQRGARGGGRAPATRARNVFGETCPQYLYLTLEEHSAQPGFEGAKWVCSTPLRTEHEHHQDDLWKCLRTNDLSVRLAPTTARSASRSRRSSASATSPRSPTASAASSTGWTCIYQGVVDGRASA